MAMTAFDVWNYLTRESVHSRQEDLSFMVIHKNAMLACCFVGILLGLAACGVSSGGSTANTPGENATPMPTLANGQGSATPAPDSVTLLLDKAQYAASDTLTITLYNKVATPITASDHQSACTIVTVQMQRNDAWVNVGKCLQGTPTRRITLDANSTMAITVAPGASNLAPNAQWQAGTYRVAFTYIPGKDEVVGPATVVYSASITVS